MDVGLKVSVCISPLCAAARTPSVQDVSRESNKTDESVFLKPKDEVLTSIAWALCDNEFGICALAGKGNQVLRLTL